MPLALAGGKLQPLGRFPGFVVAFYGACTRRYIILRCGKMSSAVCSADTVTRSVSLIIHAFRDHIAITPHCLTPVLDVSGLNALIRRSIELKKCFRARSKCVDSVLMHGCKV